MSEDQATEVLYQAIAAVVFAEDERNFDFENAEDQANAVQANAKAAAKESLRAAIAALRG